MLNLVTGELKFPGFQIGSHIGDWNLDAKELYPIYKVSFNSKWESFFLKFLNNVHIIFTKLSWTWLLFPDSWGPWGWFVCAPLGHGNGGPAIQILAALVGGHACWDCNSYLLNTHGRSSTQLPQTEGEASNKMHCLK